MATKKKVDRTAEFETSFREQVEIWKKNDKQLNRGELDETVSVLREFPAGTAIVFSYTEVRRRLFKKEEINRTAAFVKQDKRHWKREVPMRGSRKGETDEDKCDTTMTVRSIRKLYLYEENVSYTLTIGDC